MSYGYFTYNGKSTLDILDEPLCIGVYNSTDSLGMARSLNEGNPTFLRPNTNEYGTMYDSLSFNFSLVKDGYNSVDFTEEEHRIIETWLTAPKTSRELEVHTCDNKTYIYKGLFLNTEWITGGNGYLLVNLTFRSKYAYPYEVIDDTIWEPTGTAAEEWPPNSSTTANTPVIYDCQSDELEEYVYPEILLINRGGASNFVITNGSVWLDQRYNEMTVTNDINYNLLIDCENCIVYRAYREGLTDNYVGQSTMTFKDLGWHKKDPIDWLKLVPGENKLWITSDCTIRLRYKAINKTVGGWLV